MLKKESFGPKVAQYIEMCDLPCTKQELLRMADECQFPDDVINALEDLPNKTYESQDDVVETMELAGKRTQSAILGE